MATQGIWGEHARSVSIKPHHGCLCCRARFTRATYTMLFPKMRGAKGQPLFRPVPSRMGKEGAKPNRAARITAAVALTAAGAVAIEQTGAFDPIVQSADSASHLVIDFPHSAYDVLVDKIPDAEVAEAQTPQPANGGFEIAKTPTVIPAAPANWSKQYVEPNPPLSFQTAQYRNDVAQSGTHSIDSKYFCETGSGPFANGWRTDFVDVDTNQKYSEAFSAKYTLSASGTTIAPLGIVEFYDAAGTTQTGSSDFSNYAFTVGENQWQSFTRTFGPGGQEAWPVGTEKIKIEIINQGSTNQSCSSDMILATEFIDNVSFAPTSVGGIEEPIDISKLPAITETKKDASKDPWIYGAATVAAAGAVGGAYALSKKCTSE